MGGGGGGGGACNSIRGHTFGCYQIQYVCRVVMKS